MGNNDINIITIDEHSVCLELLSPVAAILDAGCAGFGFTNALSELGHKVLACDIQDFGEENKHKYARMGLYFHAGKARVTQDEDVQARRVTDITLFDKNKPAPKIKEDEIYLTTIGGCAQFMGVEKFDLIKLDIEGAEFPILQNAVHPIAKQVSVEFHCHTGRQSKEQVDKLLLYLSKWYNIYNQVWEQRHGCSENYWDILLISK